MTILPNATKIRRWREERHWSQEHLAEIAGVGLRTIQRIENGEKASADSMKALAAAFNVDVAALTDDPASQNLTALLEQRARARDALRLSFGIVVVTYLFGMLVFGGISLGSGTSMLWPAIWWTVGVAGHGLALALFELVAWFDRDRTRVG